MRTLTPTNVCHATAVRTLRPQDESKPNDTLQLPSSVAELERLIEESGFGMTAFLSAIPNALTGAVFTLFEDYPKLLRVFKAYWARLYAGRPWQGVRLPPSRPLRTAATSHGVTVCSCVAPPCRAHAPKVTIMVMGPSGTGKTTTLRRLFGRTDLLVSNDDAESAGSSATKAVTELTLMVPVDHPDGRLLAPVRLVDTPGAPPTLV